MWPPVTCLVLLPKRVVGAVQAERKRHLPRETGGFLIGVRRGPHIEVTSLTEQGPGDASTYTSFDRCCASHRQRIHSVWKLSEGLESLVGDWHSHPRGTSDASSIDRSAWRTLVRTSQQAIVGLIDAGAAVPSLYLASVCLTGFDMKLDLEYEDSECLVFTSPRNPKVKNR